MTQGLNERPAVVAALGDLEGVVDWIHANTAGLKLVGDRQRRAAYGCLDLAIEHQAAILILARAGAYASMLALARVQYEAFIRGGWLARCATEAEFENFARTDRIDKTLAEMTAAFETKVQHEGDTLVAFLHRSKKALNGFTHTGKHAITRRFGAGEIGSHYNEADVMLGVRLAQAVGLFAVLEMATYAGAEDLGRAALSVAKRVAPNPGT